MQVTEPVKPGSEPKAADFYDFDFTYGQGGDAVDCWPLYSIYEAAGESPVTCTQKQ